MRILIITFFTILFSATLIFMTRIWGLGQQHQAYDHAFFSGAAPMIIIKTSSLTSGSAAVSAKDDVVLWLDVRLSKDHVPFVLPPQKDRDFLALKQKLQEANPQQMIFTGGKLSEYLFEDITKVFPEISKLSEYYKTFPKTRFILNIVDNVSDAHSSVVDEITSLQPNARTLIQSEALLLMTSIRDLKPEWVYGTSTPDLMRLLTFSSMYILPSTQFKGDVFISPFEILKRPAFNEEVIAEMRRRKKKVFLGPIKTSKELEVAKKFEVEGYIGDDLSELLLLLGQGLKQ